MDAPNLSLGDSVVTLDQRTTVPTIHPLKTAQESCLTLTDISNAHNVPRPRGMSKRKPPVMTLRHKSHYDESLYRFSTLPSDHKWVLRSCLDDAHRLGSLQALEKQVVAWLEGPALTSDLHFASVTEASLKHMMLSAVAGYYEVAHIAPGSLSTQGFLPPMPSEPIAALLLGGGTTLVSLGASHGAGLLGEPSVLVSETERPSSPWTTLLDAATSFMSVFSGGRR